MARIMKAKYFEKEDSFLTAKMKPNASYVWKSIMANQELLRSHVRRRIGDGRTTPIWNTPWLPHTTNPMVESPRPVADALRRVKFLIDKGTGQWNMQRVEPLFNDRDKRLLEKLVVSPEYPDTWFWIDDLKGTYTVKGAYRALCGEIVTEQHNNGFIHWNQMWNLDLPPKISVFCWRATKEVLPSRINIKRHGVDIDDHCPRCSMAEESTFHALVGCTHVRKAWQLAGLVEWHHPEIPFGNWFEHLLLIKDNEKLCKVVFLIYQAWHARNTLIWEGKSISALDLRRAAEQSFTD